MEVYQREAPLLATNAAQTCLAKAPHIARSSISHLIVVSCTGFYAPGVDVDLVRALGLRPSVFRQIIGFMGCYGAFNGMRAARDICLADPEAVVLLVCVELCSIHFQTEGAPDTIVANCLFSDGASAALIASEGSVAHGRFEIVDSISALHEDSLDQMTWSIGDSGFRMTLAGTVPDVLRTAIGSFVDELVGRNGTDRRSLAYWAIHPGGRRIVEAIQESLGLDDGSVERSLAVLAENGNMSSSTILFVIDRLHPERDSLGMAMAFGPGLTLEGMLLKAIA
jgi:predicted naringenin-chalcone synthase